MNATLMSENGKIAVQRRTDLKNRPQFRIRIVTGDSMRALPDLTEAEVLELTHMLVDALARKESQ